MRLAPRGYEDRTCGQACTLRTYGSKRLQRDAFIDFVSSFSVRPSEVNALLEELGDTRPSGSEACRPFILRPRLTVAVLAGVLPALADYIEGHIESERRGEIVEAAEILLKYGDISTASDRLPRSSEGLTR